MRCQLSLWVSSPVLFLGDGNYYSTFRIILLLKFHVAICLHLLMNDLIPSIWFPSYISNRCYNIFPLILVLEPFFVIWKLLLECPDCLFLIKNNILGLSLGLLAVLIGLMQWSILFFEFYVLLMIVVRFYQLLLKVIIFFLEANIQFFELSIDLLQLLLIVRIGSDAALAATVRC